MKRTERVCVTADEIREYAEKQGNASAADLVLLYGPDSFATLEEYEMILAEMEGLE